MQLHDVQNSWAPILDSAFEQPELEPLKAFIACELAGRRDVYPALENRFRALKLTPLEDVRCVILGQDPYHADGQADGLAFSVPEGTKPPPSLRTILRALGHGGHVSPMTPNLDGWAGQGVLLLNTILTVERGSPNSHAGRGWEALTTRILQAVYRKTDPVAFLLWGDTAKEKLCDLRLSAGQWLSKAAARRTELEEDLPHLILGAKHPASRYTQRHFVRCDHFNAANEFLARNGKATIRW